MALVFPDQGENLALEMIVNKTAAENLILGLYKNDVTPGESDTEATYIEADFTGCSASSGSIAYAQQTFTSSANQSSQTIYGYRLIQASSGKLVYAERFATPQAIANNGDTIKITPTITAS
jgi:hypothetical protein